jgi:formylglycine-generating enzyme required for sulfatase activity
MEEKDSDYFFGRKRETIDVLSALAGAPDRLPVLIGNSGVGKSSLAQAGVLAALKRQAWPEDAGSPKAWPVVFQDSRQWCFLTLKPGTDPLRAVVEAFVDTWQFAATDPMRADHQDGWIERFRDGRGTLSDLIEATERRRKELDQPKPLVFFLYVDQGEELYVRSEEHQSHRFSELLAEAIFDKRLRAIMSMRSDFLGHLQSDKPLFNVHRLIQVPPLGEEELREIIGRPALLLGARFENDRLVDIITQRTAEDSVKDVGALPLLSYTLDDMWAQMVKADVGVLRLPAQSFELGGVLVDRANKFLATRPGAEAALRRVLTLRLATVREDGEPTRRRALRSEFSGEEWRLVSELADYPYRLLVTVTTDAGETYAEVAHEAIFRRWDKLREWIAAEREFLAWRGGLEIARRAWQATPEAAKHDALLMGVALTQAQSWLTKHAEDLPQVDWEFISLSVERDRKAQVRARLVRTSAYALLIGMIIGLIGWINQSSLKEQWRGYAAIRPFINGKILPYVLNTDSEHALKPKESFRECATEKGMDYCPEMVVIQPGRFKMGSPASEVGRDANEGPQHDVTINYRFAVSKFELTFEEWDNCVAYGDCAPDISDSGWGHGQRPVISVTFDDAQRYVAWLSKITDKSYQLLTEAEFEYATRAGTQTAYPWGAKIDKGNANCVGCGNPWADTQTQPVGTFAPNGFGLYDMVGNVWTWVTDCYHPDYEGAAADGSQWTNGCPDSLRHVVRGGSWKVGPERLRSASRTWYASGSRSDGVGFRVVRTLLAP